MPKPLCTNSSGLEVFGPEFWEKRLQIEEERLRPALADVPRYLKRLCWDKWCPADCFPRAILFVRDNSTLRTAEYILGEARLGGFNQHGWVEFEDLVFEPVLQEWYVKELYYAIEGARPWYRFSRPATMFLAHKTDKMAHFTYRWDMWLHLPWGNNMPISLEQAKAYFAEANRRSSPVSEEVKP